MEPKERELVVNQSITIPLREIYFEFAHAGGPGGQNVNKVSTQATLCFAVAKSAALTPSQKHRVFSLLRNRINRDGILRITCRSHRTQPANRRAAQHNFIQLLAEAFKPRPVRHATRPTRGSREQRLNQKHQRAVIKKLRQRPGEED
ncbi:MAG: aminoacyl-tRNA hydrolase [Planctomycetes bacterium]|nr:aminoacyl-tRNA hydrolase [Planctomycetota bacterium]